jgi:hypothetical protein
MKAASVLRLLASTGFAAASFAPTTLAARAETHAMSPQSAAIVANTFNNVINQTNLNAIGKSMLAGASSLLVQEQYDRDARAAARPSPTPAPTPAGIGTGAKGEHFDVDARRQDLQLNGIRGPLEAMFSTSAANHDTTPILFDAVHVGLVHAWALATKTPLAVVRATIDGQSVGIATTLRDPAGKAGAEQLVASALSTAGGKVYNAFALDLGAYTQHGMSADVLSHTRAELTVSQTAQALAGTPERIASQSAGRSR